MFVLKAAPLVRKLLIVPEQKTVFINPDADDLDLAVAQAVAHLDFGHHELDSGYFSAEQVRIAEGVAKVRLDRPDHRQNLELEEGPPTLA